MFNRAAPLLLLVGLLAAASPSLARAGMTQERDQIILEGTVAAGCLMAAAEATFIGNATVTDLGPGRASVVINDLVDENGLPTGAEIVLTLPATCNQSNILRLSSLNGGLANSDRGEGGPFRNDLPYTISIDWGGQTQTISSDEGALTVAFANAGRGDPRRPVAAAAS